MRNARDSSNRVRSDTCRWCNPPDLLVVPRSSVAGKRGERYGSEIQANLSRARRGHDRIALCAFVLCDAMLGHLHIEKREAQMNPIQQKVPAARFPQWDWTQKARRTAICRRRPYGDD